MQKACKPPKRTRLFDSPIQHCQAIVEMTQGVVLSLDPDGIILDCNTYMEKLSGTPADRIIGRNWSELMSAAHELDRPYDSLDAEEQGREPRTKVYQLHTQSGKLCFLEFNFRMIKDAEGAFIGVLIVGYDVTERYEHEKELIRERYDLIEKNKELTCLINAAQVLDNLTLHLEERLHEICKLIPASLSRPERIESRIVLDGKTISTENFKPTPHILHEDIIIQERPRGCVELAYLSDSAVAEQSPPHVFKENERHFLKTLTRHLSLIVEKQEADANKLELERQLRHADRLATIGQLAAGIAHELNEPLGNILGFAQLATKADPLPEQAGRDLDNIIKSSLHAREIIKKLMMFGRPMQPMQSLVDLNQLVEEGLYFLESRCAKTGIRIDKRLDPQLPRIKGDQSQFRQVLVNLVINATQAMPQGGELVIATGFDAGHAHLVVQDTGTGIEKAHLKRIFLPFFTTKDVNEGTGLGLSVVHGIVSAHKGTIDVESKIGQGSIFTVKLPLYSHIPEMEAEP